MAVIPENEPRLQRIEEKLDKLADTISQFARYRRAYVICF